MWKKYLIYLFILVRYISSASRIFGSEFRMLELLDTEEALLDNLKNHIEDQTKHIWHIKR